MLTVWINCTQGNPVEVRVDTYGHIFFPTEMFTQDHKIAAQEVNFLLALADAQIRRFQP